MSAVTLYRYDAEGLLETREAVRVQLEHADFYVFTSDRTKDGAEMINTRWMEAGSWRETQPEALSVTISELRSLIRTRERRLGEDRALLRKLEAEAGR